MSKFLPFDSGLLVWAGYLDPKIHKHLALHIMVSLHGERYWEIDGKVITAKGVCIDSDIPHTGYSDGYGTLVFLFPITSKYTASLRTDLLCRRPYCRLDKASLKQFDSIYQEERNWDGELPEHLLSTIGLNASSGMQYEERVQKMILYIEKKKALENDIYNQLSSISCLSKSRMSHLFKEETGMTLHSYLAQKRLEKALSYYERGRSITNAAMDAGFDSPSHCASTCKRVFGISISDVYKTIEH